MPPPAVPSHPAILAESPQRLRRARWLVAVWLGLSLAVLILLALGAPPALCST